MVGTGKLFRVLGINFMTSGLLYTSQSTLSSVFDFGLLQAELHFLQNRQENAVTDLVHFGYCHYVIKYLMRDMMDYHCLRVFRSRDRRMGKHSPGFSVFRTRVRHGCSNAEPCRVPIQSTFVEIVPFDN